MSNKPRQEMTDDELFGANVYSKRGIYEQFLQWADRPKSNAEQTRLVFSGLYMDTILEKLRPLGDSIVEPLLARLKEPQAQDTSQTEEIYGRPLRLICTLLIPYMSPRVAQAIRPFADHQDPGLRLSAAWALACSGLPEMDDAVIRVYEQDPSSAQLIIKGLAHAAERKVGSPAIGLALWPAMENLIDTDNYPNYTYWPALKAMVWADPQKAYATFEKLGKLSRNNKWFECILEAYQVRPDSYPRAELEKLLKDGEQARLRRELGASDEQMDDESKLASSLFTPALDLLALLPEESVEQRLLAWRQSPSKRIAHVATLALVERYKKGICHAVPGPRLSPSEQLEFNTNCHRVQLATNIWDSVLCNGLEQYPALYSRQHWELAAQGMELVGAKKCAAACHEIIKHFGPALDAQKNLKLNASVITDEIRNRLGDDFKRLERQVVDQEEITAGLMENYVIQNRDVYLRNRGDTTWRFTMP
jgi:hypothetical protein